MCAVSGKIEEAIREFGKAVGDSQANPYAVGYLGYACGPPAIGLKLTERY